MPVETPSLFAQAIQEHLELKQRNSELERQMPLRAYKSEDPFENHPLFKTEEQARREETLDGLEPDVVAHGNGAAVDWPGEEAVEHTAVPSNAELEGSLWGKESRDFDCGD